MRKWLVTFMSVAVMVSACGGDDSADDPSGLDNQPSESGQQTGAEDSVSGGDANTDSGSGTLENPTPEAPGPLPPDGFRIGDDVWERTVPITRGQCFVQEGDGATPFAVWGTLDADDNLSFAVSYGEDGSFSSEVTSDSMFWVAGQRDGSDLTVTHDVATQSISGEGLFYNMQSDEWAYGSFEFTCTG